MGCTLASIHSAADFQGLKDMVISGSLSYAWIGLNDRKEERDWVNSDGTPVDYTNWDTGEPNNGVASDCHHHLLLLLL